MRQGVRRLPADLHKSLECPVAVRATVFDVRLFGDKLKKSLKMFAIYKSQNHFLSSIKRVRINCFSDAITHHVNVQPVIGQIIHQSKHVIRQVSTHFNSSRHGRIHSLSPQKKCERSICTTQHSEILLL